MSCSIISVSAKTQMNLVIRPDCADLPYFLRAYFAFKMGLPFGYAKCTRGGGGDAPRCPVWWNIQNEEPRPDAPEDDRRRRAAGSCIAPAAGAVSRDASLQRATQRTGGEAAGGESRAGRRRGRRGSCRGSAIICATTLADGVHSGTGRTRAERRQHRFLSCAAHRGRRCVRAPSMPIPMGTF